MRATLFTAAVTLSLTAALAAAAGCKDSGGPATGSSTAASGATIEIQGAGATFPYPLYSKWISEYQKIEPQVRINYQSIGSGGGIRQLLERTVDFGASDVPMTGEELKKAGPGIVQIPVTLGAIVITYNVPGVTARLQLSPEVIAGIFLGEIKRWNAAPLVALNPKAKLPAIPISIIHRSDGSGTTAVFTEYLARVSAGWKERVGAGKSVRFPLGIGAKGNEGVAGQVKATPGSIGYVELAYARQTELAYARIRNRTGAFVEPSLENIATAAAGEVREEADLRRSIVDAGGRAAYPISAFSYILVYREQEDARKGAAMARFLWWATHQGQRFGPPLDYARLPVQALPGIEASLRELRAGGRPLLSEGAVRGPTGAGQPGNHGAGRRVRQGGEGR
jgi:phosphate transport system substrate-binding protein